MRMPVPIHCVRVTTRINVIRFPIDVGYTSVGIMINLPIIRWVDKTIQITKGNPFPNLAIICKVSRVVGSNGLITSVKVNIQGRIGRSVPFFEYSAHRHTGILCCDCERTFDDIGRQPSEERAKQLIIRFFRFKNARRREQIVIMDQEARSSKRILKTPVKTRTLHLSEPYDSRSTQRIQRGSLGKIKANPARRIVQ
jgi:hypothetical protein